MTRLFAAVLVALVAGVIISVCIFLRCAYLLLVFCSLPSSVNEDARQYEVETVLRGQDSEES